jgi:N-methylhydantoinase A
MRGGKRLGCDIGGTFTDFVVIDDADGTIRLEKVLTTPAEPEGGIFDGIDQLEGVEPGLLRDAASVVHGTTLVINALIERKGSRTALITTAGFRDILEMRSELRYDVYDMQIEYPEPLAPRALRFEVEERIAADGRIVTPLQQDDLERVLERLRGEKVESVAVALIHSYANPVHEREIANFLAGHAPELTVSLSSDVLPRIKEYERTSTTVANAYVRPKVRAYIGRLREGLAERGFEGRFYVMQSSGGVIEASNAIEFPIRILESGPAAGVAASRWWGEFSGCRDLLSFDMGGTTAKLCAVTGGEALVTDEYEAARHQHFKKGSGLAVNVPVLDLLEIGTGGGSIAHIDRLGLLKVGPQSAGAAPGPACYGRGGELPTVTDADLLLGYLEAGSFLGGAMRLDRAAAERAVQSSVAAKLGGTVAEAAFGIHEVANEAMASAARLHLAERGQDAAALTMVAYGGAGPVHAFGLARKLGIRKLLIPPAAGVMSALGMLVANIAVDRVRTMKSRLAELDFAAAARAFEELEDEARKLLPRSDGVSFKRAAEMRYVGQGYNVTVPLPPRERWAGFDVARARAAFDDVYRAIFGRVYEDVAIELINLRLVAEIVPEHPFRPALLAAATEPVTSAIRGERPVFVPGEAFRSCPVIDRYRLRPSHVVVGPALIEERETTTFIGRDARVEIDERGVLSVSLE